jgi:SAM-dependent methyltransferase
MTPETPPRASRRAIARALARNARSALTRRLGTARSDTGATHARLSVEQSVAYVDAVFEDYARHGLGGPDAVRGKRVLEIGPGDSLGVALRLLAAGAAEVVCVDRFRIERNGERERAVYRALGADPGPALASGALRVLEGVGVEDAPPIASEGRFDLVASCAVLEEVDDLEHALGAVDRLLRPGGRTVHRVDLRDYGIFTAAGGHPLAFLTVRHGLYRAMTAGSPSPNRALASDYERALRELGHDVELLVTQVLGGEPTEPRSRLEAGVDYGEPERALVEAIRPRLRPRWRERPLEDLLVCGILVRSRKPGAEPLEAPAASLSGTAEARG